MGRVELVWIVSMVSLVMAKGVMICFFYKSVRWVGVWSSEVISSYICEVVTFCIHVISMGVVCMLVVIVLMSVWTNVGIEIKGMLNEFPWMVVMGRSEVIMLLVDKVLTISVHIVCICVVG